MKSRREPFRHQCACTDCRQHPRGGIANEHRAINRVLATLNEKSRRRFVGLLALQWGRGGMARLHTITGLSGPTIRRGRNEVQRVEHRAAHGRVRAAGAGRPAVEKNSPGC